MEFWCPHVWEASIPGQTSEIILILGDRLIPGRGSETDHESDHQGQVGIEDIKAHSFFASINWEKLLKKMIFKTLNLLFGLVNVNIANIITVSDDC